jgi:hypothetical protein
MGIAFEDLPKIDLMPKIQFRMLLTPELATIFSESEDELLENIGIITSVLDGKGYTSDSGALGQRGYYGNSMFVWVGATVDIPYRVHRLLSTLGPKLYCCRLSHIDPSDTAVEASMNEKFEAKRMNLKMTLNRIYQTLQTRPTILWSGNGYHIYLPIKAFILEEEEVFAKFQASVLAPSS